jgi:hypothetical protein
VFDYVAQTVKQEALKLTIWKREEMEIEKWETELTAKEFGFCVLYSLEVFCV